VKKQDAPNSIKKCKTYLTKVEKKLKSKNYKKLIFRGQKYEIGEVVAFKETEET
jgi:predicted DNA-binding protein YlxM (UPF0122 family)